MEKKIKLIMVGLFLCVGMAMAQTSVTGTVVSQDDGEPVIGASVRVVGEKNGAVTDANGKFSITLPAGRNKLHVSYVGMNPQDVTVKGSSVRVVLTTDQTDLDEVMVVAYGTAKKSAFTGSAAVLDDEQIKKTADSNPIQALTGKVAGVQINSTSGQPGNAKFNINVRGISSINAETDPLIVVDGVPFDGDMNALNTNDIASMTVLKDAASAALYGARGANGVVLITTKSGQNNTASITVDAKWGSNSRAIPDYEYIDNPAGYYEMWYKGLKNYATYTLGYGDSAAHQWASNNLINSSTFGLLYNVYNVPEGQTLIGTNGKLNPNATLGNVINYNGNEYMLLPDSWADAAYQNGLRQEYTVTATGSNDRGSFYGSFNYLDNEGITYGSDYQRLSGRLKADYKIRPWLKVGGNLSYTHYSSHYLDGDGDNADSGSLFALRSMAPIYPLYIRDGKGNIIMNTTTGMESYDYGDGEVIGLNRPYMQMSNPMSDVRLNTYGYNGNQMTAVGFAEIRFLKDFTFTTNNSGMVNEQRANILQQPLFGQQATYHGAISVGHDRTWSYTYQQLLNWHHQFDKHDVEVMLGHEYYRSHYYTLSSSRTNIYSITNSELSGAITDSSMDSYTTDYNTEGYFGRAQYNYDTKYFASLSYRRDASSRFHPDHRWGNFWSFGAAWLINKESWFNAPWVDELKLKASYGEQGNDKIGEYRYTDTYTLKNSDGNISLVPSSTKGNKDITWEKNANFNIGVEFSLFRGRLSGSIEYFNRRTSDMLAWFTLPPSFGYSGYYDNIGNMNNKGLEIELDGKILRTKDLEWGVNLNFTTYKNKITKMPTENKTELCDGVRGYSSGNYFYGEGEEMYTWHMIQYAGVDPETGEALYWKDVTEKVLDADGNVVKDEYGLDKEIVTSRETTKKASEATQHLCGGALPWGYGGFGTTFAWKGLDFSIDFTYQLGGKVYDSGYANSMDNTRGHALHVDLQNAWTAENTNTNIPLFTVNNTNMAYQSDRFLTSASYLCLQNINIGYTLPKNWVAKAGLTNVRIYATGANLWLWSKRQGLDPRQSITGANSAAYYSPIRTISGGITLTL